MNKKNIFKIAVDIAMIALFVTFFNIGLLGFKFHVIGGIIFAAFIIHIPLTNIAQTVTNKQKLIIYEILVLVFKFLSNILFVILTTHFLFTIICTNISAPNIIPPITWNLNPNNPILKNVTNNVNENQYRNLVKEIKSILIGGR